MRTARTTCVSAGTSTYQTGVSVVARRAAARSRRALAASGAAREWSTTRAAAPWARIAGTPAGSVVATVSVSDSAPRTQAPA